MDKVPSAVATSVALGAWNRTRTVISGLWLAGLAVLYFGLIYPIAIQEPLYSGYRFSFSLIDDIYAVNIGILAVEWLYKLARPPMSYSSPEQPIGGSGVLSWILKLGFVLSVGGSYVSGAAVASPDVFNPVTAFLGQSVTVWFGIYLHEFFATSIIIFGALFLIFEVAKIAMRKSTFRDWFIKGRYPEIKLMWWLLAVAVLIQGTVGLFLLGTISPYGPWGLIGLNSYSFENLARLIHDPMGAVTFAIFTNHIYFRLRPEYHIR